MNKRIFILLDGSAIHAESWEDAKVFDVAMTEVEAIHQSLGWIGWDVIWIEYQSCEDGTLVNGKIRPDIKIPK